MTKKQKDSIISWISAICSAVMLFAVARFVVPGGTGEQKKTQKTTVPVIEQYVLNAKADALGSQAYIRKHYAIPLEDMTAPKPNEDNFVYLDDMDVGGFQSLISQLEDNPLTEGKPVIFNNGNNIRYYIDDTIIAICWQEYIRGNLCSLCEVFIQDASQFRRKLTQDSFDSPERSIASRLASESNAVVAMNGDYYKFRNMGICVYQGELKRCSGTCYSVGLYDYNIVDTLLVDKQGNFSTIRYGQDISKDEVQSLVEDKDIWFSLSFGPSLIENGEICLDASRYPIGEINKEASRAAICQVGPLHYLYLNVSWHTKGNGLAGCTVRDLAEILYGKGVETAYNLDGGQSAEIVFNNELYNPVNYDSERDVGDCIYFATAIPESENNRKE